MGGWTDFLVKYSSIGSIEGLQLWLLSLFWVLAVAVPVGAAELVPGVAGGGSLQANLSFTPEVEAVLLWLV